MIAVPELPREGARRSADARVEEAEGLAEAIGIDVVGSRSFRVRAVRPATLLGKGQIEELAEMAKAQNEKIVEHIGKCLEADAVAELKRLERAR